MDPASMAVLYRAGRTMREIAAEAGCCHTTVLWHLRRTPGYKAMLSRVLRRRVEQAERAYTITRLRERPRMTPQERAEARRAKRRLKHTLAILARCRPAIYAKMIEVRRPKHCSECSSALSALSLGGLWSWACGYCGESGAALNGLPR